MPWEPLHKEEVHLRGGQQSCHGDRRATPTTTTLPPSLGVATGTRNEETKKWMLARVTSQRGEGFSSLTGPRLKKVPRLNLNTTQRAEPPHLREQLVPPKLLTFV